MRITLQPRNHGGTQFILLAEPIFALVGILPGDMCTSPGFDAVVQWLIVLHSFESDGGGKSNGQEEKYPSTKQVIESFNRTLLQFSHRFDFHGDSGPTQRCMHEVQPRSTSLPILLRVGRSEPNAIRKLIG